MKEPIPTTFALAKALGLTEDRMDVLPGLIYLASPYSHPDATVREQRFLAACEHAPMLMRAGWLIFSPIAHTHPIALDELPKGWDFWERYDRAFLDRCDGIIVLKLPGWEESKGVQAEIKIMLEAGKPIQYHEWCRRGSPFVVEHAGRGEKEER